MARVVTPLTDSKIKNAKVQDKDYNLADGNGLSLLVRVSGNKYFIFRYLSPITQKRNRMSLGQYPNMTLKQARDKTIEFQNLISDGIDPVQQKKTEEQKIKADKEKNIYTFQKVLDLYYEHRTKTHRLKEITVTKDKARVENHFVNRLPKKDKTPIHSVTYKETVKILKELENEDKLETLRKVKAIIINVFKYAYAEDIINDVEIFGRLQVYSFVTPKTSKNNPTFTKKEDIKKLYNDIINYDKNLISKYLLLMTIHTAQRQGSIVTSRWCDVDFKNKVWIIPKEYMKGTASATKDHHVPLSDNLIKYLKELKAYTGDSQYLFPNSQVMATRNKYPHISNNTCRSTLRALGYSNEQQTAHGFRAMFKTVCKEHQEEHKLSNEFVERVLAHKVGNDVENAYNRANSIEDMRKTLSWWSEYLEGLLDG